MEIGSWLQVPEQAMLKPLWLAASQCETLHLKVWDVRTLVAGVFHDKQHIDNGFRRETLDRRRADMLEAADSIPKGVTHISSQFREHNRPLQVVWSEVDGAVQRFSLADNTTLAIIIW